MNRIVLTLLLLLGYWCPFSLIAAQPVADQDVRTIEAAIKNNEPSQITKICKDWQQSGTFSLGVLNWNYNALMSLEPGAILVVQNDEQVYPLWMLQLALGIRENVTVLSFETLKNPVYQAFIAQWKKMELKGSNSKEILGNLLAQNDKTPVYLGVMLDKAVIEQEKNNLYLTGLALKFSASPYENLRVLKAHYEHDFLLDYLRQDLTPEPKSENVAAMNMNYLPAFLMLYRHYSDHDNEEKAADLRNMSLHIAQAGNREQEVSSFFIIPQVVKPGNIAVKAIEKSMKKVGDKLWASEVETTNEQYERFLTDVLKNKDYDQITRCKSPKTNWRDLLPDSSKAFTDARLYRHGHPDDANMPVQQITHEAAQLYCAWLTASYNISTDKKKFKKVVFRLPTEAEWMAAARAGRENTPYPWGGYYYRNSKGCYLLNLNATEPCPDCETKGIANDGGYFTVPAETYFPNDFGLYNMSGNVAEMIQEPGKAKGGSWKDDGYHTQISPATTYTSPSPAIGFRVFMEVIEE